MSGMFVQSHSSMETFTTCPRQYEAKYITRETQYKESEAAAWGNAVHTALEQFLLRREELPANMPYTRYATWVLRRALRSGALLYVESQYGILRDGRPCEYRDRTGMVRAKVDVIITYADGTADVFDWKTGKVKLDRKQLLLYALMVFAHFPNIHTIRTGYVWLGQPDEEAIPEPVVYTRAQVPAMLESVHSTIDLIASAHELGVFNPTPNGLCRKWCDVTACPFHGRGRSW